MSEGFIVSSGMGDLYATIGVTYPEGSALNCKDAEGTLELAANNTSGAWVFNIPYAATWIVTITDPTGEHESKSETVEITYEGQSVSVELSYKRYIFKSGVGALIDLRRYAQTNGKITIDTDYIVTSASSTDSMWVAARTDGKIDLSNYSKMCMTYAAANTTGASAHRMFVTNSAFTDINSSPTQVAYTVITDSTTPKTIELDLTSIFDSLYCGFHFAGALKITDWWLE